MLSSHAQASGDEFLNRFAEFRLIYNSLLDHTIACAKFIEGYAKKSLIGRLPFKVLSAEVANISLRTDSERKFSRGGKKNAGEIP